MVGDPNNRGIIHIDALINDDEVARSVISGIRTLALDPAQVKDLAITPAHGGTTEVPIASEISLADRHERDRLA
jgi:hypothetical protein